VGPDFILTGTRVSDLWHADIEGGLDAGPTNVRDLSQSRITLEALILRGLFEQTKPLIIDICGLCKTRGSLKR
jgi:hypothetical protein